jgi:hypothetical protein
MANAIATGMAAPVGCTGGSPGCRNLRPPWPKGVSSNPRGRPSYRALFEEALGRAVTENAEVSVQEEIPKDRLLVFRVQEGLGSALQVSRLQSF